MRVHLILLFGAMLAARLPSQAASEMVRRDWYFRESLAAIRDWEDILARWETKTPEAERTPVFPVPANGEAVVWPNPIPLMLLPADDARKQVRVSTSAKGAVVGYQHPGGGAKDQWYHHYVRKFDRLTAFRPQPAPFVLRLDAPFDFRLGANELPVNLRNVTGQPLALTVRLRLLTRQQERGCGEKNVTLAAGESQTVKLPVELTSPGGGLLLLTVATANQTCWLPLFTHVEDVPAVLQGIEQVLTDTPDAEAVSRLQSLRQRASNVITQHAAHSTQDVWRSLFDEASALRDSLLLRRITFDTLLFVKRKPFNSEQPFMDAHHCYNRPGGGIYRLSPARPDGKVTPVVDSLGEGIYRDLCLSWDGRRLLFAFGNGADRGAPPGGVPHNYHVHEIGADGRGLRQITHGPKNDCEPFYFPDGRIGFTSDRSEHYVMCGSDIHVANLFAMNADGSGPRQLSHNVFNEFNPSVLPDGRIIYDRWEYNERSVTSLHKLFTMNPDGTHVAPYYGNATIRPNVIMFPRPVPGSTKVMALFTAHHGQTHGPIGLIDVSQGLDGDGPITLLTPGVPVTGEKAEDSRHGWFSDPMPLSETTYLCSFTPTVQPWLERSWALYVGDRHGNLALVYRDPDISCAEPVPLVARPRPPERPSLAAAAANAEASFLLMDVYRGLDGVPRGAAKFLRIIEDVPRKGVREGGVIVTAETKIYTVKRILGIVPVEPDGSAHFIVPADRNVYFEVLDAQQREIQRMRSVVCLKPEEKRTCVGCHEPQHASPPNVPAAAASLPPTRPVPPPWGAQTLSFLRDVQPLINAQCVRCHAHDRAANGVILTDDLTDQFTVACEELTGFISAANAMRWDHADDVHPRPPYTYGSRVSRLTKLLEAGHHGVQLSEEERLRLVNWIDANGVYYDRYESVYPKRAIFAGSARNALNGIHARRCARCHGQDADGRHDTWWLSLNRRDVKQSRALQAPLARAAGGWQRCDETVFTNADDPDYTAMLAALTAVADKLAQRPREDLLSIRGTDAERQVVSLPAPPPRSARREPPLGADGIYLSDLPWESARSGWTPNGDALPRRDRDIENHPLRLGTRAYRKGIGTHAPSEIVYRLGGKYSRFAAVIGGAQANGTVVFQVFGDDKPLYDSGAMQGLREVKTIDVAVAGVQRLRLVVTDAGDNYFCDMANWADARLLNAATTARK